MLSTLQPRFTKFLSQNHCRPYANTDCITCNTDKSISFKKELSLKVWTNLNTPAHFTFVKLEVYYGPVFIRIKHVPPVCVTTGCVRVYSKVQNYYNLNTEDKKTIKGLQKWLAGEMMSNLGDTLFVTLESLDLVHKVMQTWCSHNNHH